MRRRSVPLSVITPRLEVQSGVLTAAHAPTNDVCAGGDFFHFVIERLLCCLLVMVVFTAGVLAAKEANVQVRGLGGVGGQVSSPASPPPPTTTPGMPCSSTRRRWSSCARCPGSCCGPLGEWIGSGARCKAPRGEACCSEELLAASRLGRVWHLQARARHVWAAAARHAAARGGGPGAARLGAARLVRAPGAAPARE